MNIMLVRPKPHKNSLGLTDLMCCEPLELEYVSTVIKRMHHKVLLIDMMLEQKSLSYFIRKKQPDVVMFTSYITHVNVIQQYADSVKAVNPKIITVVGGIHSEVLPDDFLYESIDYVLGINGLENIEVLLHGLEQGNRDIEFYHDKIHKDYVLPMPDRNVTRRYRKHYDYAYHVPCALLKTSFGCPYSCKFCFCVEITRHSYYVRELRPVMQELSKSTEPNVFIVDDNFLVNRQRIITFCDLLDQYKIHKTFIIFGRADFIAENPDMIELLSQHGLDAVFVGIESFKQDDLNDFNKKSDVRKNEIAAQVLYRYGVDLYAGAIVGPDWDKKDFHDFIVWLKRMHIRFTNLQPLVPLPGTAIYEQYKEQLLLNPSEYEKWDLTHLAIMPTKLTPTQYYFQIIKGYYKTSVSASSISYIYRRCGLKVTLKCIKGAMRTLWHYIKMMWEYRKVGAYGKPEQR